MSNTETTQQKAQESKPMKEISGHRDDPKRLYRRAVFICKSTMEEVTLRLALSTMSFYVSWKALEYSWQQGEKIREAIEFTGYLLSR